MTTISVNLKKLYNEFGEPKYDAIFLISLLLCEVILCHVVIRFVSYTEIDWEAYMQEVETWIVDGQLDYRQIRGGTGPLVYPAGFLYLFAVLRHFTDHGRDIRQAQYIFGFFYVIFTALVLTLYAMVARNVANQQSSSTTSVTRTVWSWRLAMGLTCLSKRLHSIFVLRLFNDGPAMLLFYLSALLFTKYYWKLGCFVFSLAVSIKMNVLLFAPGLLLLLLQSQDNLLETIQCLAICGVTQLVLGAPFLLSYPESYLRKAFELDRVFFYKWTVNWKVRTALYWYDSDKHWICTRLTQQTRYFF
jgi:alpha-1,3-mannosyltransferase